MRVKFIFDDGKGFNHIDEADVESFEKAEQELRDLIEEFNRVEEGRHGDEACLRALVGIVHPVE